jgi:hypothetical protein
MTRLLHLSYTMTKALLVLFFVFLLSIFVLVAVFGIESTPLVEPVKRMSHQDIARIKLLLRQHDPRHLKKQKDRTLLLTERDLNLLLEYAVPHALDANSQVDLQPNGMMVRLTVKLPDSMLGDYVNITTDITDVDGTIHVERLTLGGLSLPVWLLEPLLMQSHRIMLARFDEYRAAVEAIRSYRFNDDDLIVVYQLDPNHIERLRQSGKVFLFPESETHRILAYHEELARISNQYASRRLSIDKVLPPLFQLAAVRTSESGEPQSENRALILTLTMHTLGMKISRFVDIPLEPPVKLPQLTVLGRHDLVQHYLVSAALTVSAGSGLAGAMGVFKELDDSRGGSGFSFADLLADRAGIRLAEMATGTEQWARLLQQRMSGPLLLETDFMPSIENLPEGIMELEFKHRYRDLDSENYRIIEDEIESRLSRCKVYSPQDDGAL